MKRTNTDQCSDCINSYDDKSGYCRYGFKYLYYSTQDSSFHICQNYTTDPNNPSIIKAPVNIYSMNGRNTRVLGSIDKYTFGGYVSKQYDKNDILTYVGYEKIGKIVYDVNNEPVLSVNKIKVPIPDIKFNKDYLKKSEK